jgi:hypothetical protein
MLQDVLLVLFLLTPGQGHAAGKSKQVTSNMCITLAHLALLVQGAVEDSSGNLQPVSMGLEEHEYSQQVNTCLLTLENLVAGP